MAVLSNNGEELARLSGDGSKAYARGSDLSDLRHYRSFRSNGVLLEKTTALDSGPVRWGQKARRYSWGWKVAKTIAGRLLTPEEIRERMAAQVVRYLAGGWKLDACAASFRPYLEKAQKDTSPKAAEADTL